MFSAIIADRAFLIQNRYDHVREEFAKYLSPEAGGTPISVIDEESEREQTGGFPPEYLESVAICRKIADRLIDDGVILFHGSAVAVDGEAYLFTAASGYGKSTHARLWRELLGPRAVMINDDKPFLRMTDNGVLVYGSPWDGKHHLSANIAVPLKAVCILERSPENRLEPIPREKALAMLIRQTHRPEDPILLKKTLMLIERLSQSAETYRMWFNTELDAARVACRGMCERKEQ